MASKLELDPRVDPRIKKFFAGLAGAPKPNVASREELLAQEHSPEGLCRLRQAGRAVRQRWTARISRLRPAWPCAPRPSPRRPTATAVKIQYIRPEGDEILPCIYYIHGGRMAFSSAYEGNYKTWGRMIAARGLAVAMVDFRNAVHPNSAPEIAPFPAGLNDCISGLKWLRANATFLRIDPNAHRCRRRKRRRQSQPRRRHEAEARGRPRSDQRHLRPLPLHRRPVAAGPVSLIHRERGHRLFASRTTAPRWPTASRPSTKRNPLAWPAFANSEDVEGPAAGRDQRQRVRPAARRRHRLLSAADAAPASLRAAASSWAHATASKSCRSSAPTSPARPPPTSPSSPCTDRGACTQTNGDRHVRFPPR